MQERIMSIFIDESGDFGPYEQHSPYYQVAMVLHDQSIVAGIGNIYSDEILFAAHVYPEKLCTLLTDEEWDCLAKTIPEIIAWGIDLEDLTPAEYLAGGGKEYRNAEYLRAYGREGTPCARCGTIMERIKVGGRSSCYCPACQK